ncbi:MAG: hypothetical protein COY11_02710 [Candidatus Portnoybacteria bacterium CG_4_10_14_0_2_um_filter_44_20]|uniref:Uncharacterized protein n=1 Tax=Candidatus Portnoybacteria bacterium CG_4_10_14_0_2_um_filter_44_20 TaxID=1974799 RepID=A0A2M7UGL8_9BACT|nr:MAG: hypothetical protein COY11_02710 [Candidatus Portnoybacteria bacterium CG_4_10_14_0_2_um_filter_44_20]
MPRSKPNALLWGPPERQISFLPRVARQPFSFLSKNVRTELYNSTKPKPAPAVLRGRVLSYFAFYWRAIFSA